MQEKKQEENGFLQLNIIIIIAQALKLLHL